MTDNKIIQTLECDTHIGCEDCPYFRKNCNGIIDDEATAKDIIDLINRQKAEIERLTAQRDKAVKDFTEFAQRAYLVNPFACRYCIHYTEGGGCLWKLEHEDVKEGCEGRQFEYNGMAGDTK